jgi:iron complex outermembrane receptor protein
MEISLKQIRLKGRKKHKINRSALFSTFFFLFSFLTFSQEKSNDSIKAKKLDEVLVSAVRATEKAPVSFSN